MNQPKEFYNNSDLWDLPRRALLTEQGQDAELMEPYYVIMNLPDGENEEFILMNPFIRAGKKNMVAWMAAKCDGADYGKMVLYQFPEEKNIYGPEQIAGRAKQDTTISHQGTHRPVLGRAARLFHQQGLACDNAASSSPVAPPRGPRSAAPEEIRSSTPSFCFLYSSRFCGDHISI